MPVPETVVSQSQCIYEKKGNREISHNPMQRLTCRVEVMLLHYVTAEHTLITKDYVQTLDHCTCMCVLCNRLTSDVYSDISSFFFRADHTPAGGSGLNTNLM